MGKGTSYVLQLSSDKSMSRYVSLLCVGCKMIYLNTYIVHCLNMGWLTAGSTLQIDRLINILSSYCDLCRVCKH